jgi:hypothetical protein
MAGREPWPRCAELSFLSAIAMFGAAVDVTVAELHIESLFPADAAAAQAAVLIAMQAAVVAASRRSSFARLRPASGRGRVGA